MAIPLVICPLAYERSFLRKPLRGRALIVVSGPGADNVAAAVEKHADPKPSIVVLCGTAGALRPCEGAPRIGTVMDSEAVERHPSAMPPGNDEPVGVLGLDSVAGTVERKRQLAGAYGAHLVDMESHAFASTCSRLGLRWAVIRGVSDGPNEALPAGIEHWVDDRGRARPLRLLGQCVLEPRTLGAALRLRSRTRGAMRTAVSRLLELLVQERNTSVDPLAGRAQTPLRSAKSPGRVTTVVEEQLSVERIERERSEKKPR